MRPVWPRRGCGARPAEWQIETTAGPTVTARTVLVATNAYSDGLVPGLARSLVPLHSFQIATAPLTLEQQAMIASTARRSPTVGASSSITAKAPTDGWCSAGAGEMEARAAGVRLAASEAGHGRLFPVLEGGDRTPLVWSRGHDTRPSAAHPMSRRRACLPPPVAGGAAWR